MGRTILALIAASLACSGAAQPAEVPDQGHGRELPEGAANLDFVIFNRTGQTIIAVSISPAREEEWSADILVQREVPPGERAAASYTRDVELCRWDVRVIYQGGRRQSWPAVDLCATVRVELR